MTGVWQDEARSGNAGYADGLEVVVYTYTVRNKQINSREQTFLEALHKNNECAWYLPKPSRMRAFLRLGNQPVYLLQASPNS